MSILDFFNTWYRMIVNVNDINDEFEQELATILLKYNVDRENIDSLPDHVSSLSDWLRQPLTEQLPKFDVTLAEWLELYDEIVNLIPFYNDVAKTTVLGMKDYLSKIYYTNNNPMDVFREYIGGSHPSFLPPSDVC